MQPYVADISLSTPIDIDVSTQEEVNQPLLYAPLHHLSATDDM